MARSDWLVEMQSLLNRGHTYARVHLLERLTVRLVTCACFPEGLCVRHNYSVDSAFFTSAIRDPGGAIGKKSTCFESRKTVLLVS